MKLRSKILLISCITVFFTSILCNTVILFLMSDSFRKEAESVALKEAANSFREIKSETGRVDWLDVDERIMAYFFKKEGDDYLICYKKEGEDTAESFEDSEAYEPVYNNTVFQIDDLEGLSYVEVNERLDGSNIEKADLEYQGKYFLVYRLETYSVYRIYKLEDITYVWNRMEVLSVSLILLTVIATALASALLSGILKRILKPLQELNTGAKQIACGQYDRRISFRGNDEIGQLSENFNKMAEAVEQRTRNLEESERRKTLFMGDLTHELKTPLTAISGYSKTLLAVKLSEEDEQEALSYIYSESCRLERLSRKMMDLLLLEEETGIELEKIGAGALFRSAGESCFQMLKDKDMTLECQENGEVFLVDRDLMTDVLINLIDNAIKASEPGGRILLSAREKQITVRDFGIGIPEEEREKILEPFYMVDKSRSRKNGGAGLGLAITAMILKKHNCTLSIESRVGEGSSMILQFV